MKKCIKHFLVLQKNNRTYYKIHYLLVNSRLKRNNDPLTRSAYIMHIGLDKTHKSFFMYKIHATISFVRQWIDF